MTKSSIFTDSSSTDAHKAFEEEKGDTFVPPSAKDKEVISLLKGRTLRNMYDYLFNKPNLFKDYHGPDLREHFGSILDNEDYWRVSP